MSLRIGQFPKVGQVWEVLSSGYKVEIKKVGRRWVHIHYFETPQNCPGAYLPPNGLDEKKKIEEFVKKFCLLRETREDAVEVYNHFDEFCEFVKQQTWMSEEFQDRFIGKLSNAMADAFNRGKVEGRKKL